LTLTPWPDAAPALMAVPASWNDDPPGTSMPHWRQVARERACAVILANRYGVESFSNGDPADFAHSVSCIIDRQGRVLTQTDPSQQRDQIIMAELADGE
ncbi:MAG: hypothetical protein NTZ05_20145, partial [Chloroflexi bacterium]|nr:hypothetical protein [Chloroflexota bacterium]